jgi:cyclopropane-fatty-acyl-phospholipid synthase
LILRRLAGLTSGTLVMTDADGAHRIGTNSGDGCEARITVRNSRFYSRTVLGGSLAAAESYLQGEWDCEDLLGVLRLLGRENAECSKLERGFADVIRPARATWNWLRRNTRSGSRRNIAAHYDLSNDFFQLMLDPTMTYSAGIFESPAATLEEASRAKYDRICRKLALSPQDHVVEIGTGWGDFALHAASNYGCRVTTTTISQQQHSFAQERIHRRGLSDRITVLLQDYRDLSGSYDKLVSIEMIEAVGHRFLDTYFAKCCQLLKPDGMMALQAITIPDQRYDEYRKNVEFIQRYIFPGGCLPSFSAIGGALKRGTDFRLVHSEDFAEHYAETLARWRQNFWFHADRVRRLGFDERFMRMWNYYLCYCEAGFRERQIGVSQVLLSRPDSRRSLVGAV